MTAQITDSFFFENNDYSLVALSAPIGFEPKDYGLEAYASSTACWRGYWCDYAVEEKKLFLERLYLYNAEGNYPDFNGVAVSPQKYEKVAYTEGFDPEIKYDLFPENFGHRTYEAHMPMKYTGRILLGDGFLRDYYIHMGFQRAWAYEKLIELVFEDGIIKEVNDHSHVAAELRDMIQRDPKKFEELMHANIPAFVEDSFSLDYKAKAWWI